MPPPVLHPTSPLIRIALALLGVICLASPLLAHPQDGPHADLRIAVGERTVTWNIGMNLAFADEIVDVGREAFDVLAVVEEPAIREALVEHLTKKNQVVINGDVRTPVLRKFTIGRADNALLPLFPRTGLRALTRFSCVLEYPAPDGVESLEVTWDGFPIDVLTAEREPGLDPAPMTIEAQLQAEGKVEILRFIRSLPTITWNTLGSDPAAALLPVPTPPSETTEPRRIAIGVPMIIGGVLALLGAGIGLGTSKRLPGLGVFAVGVLLVIVGVVFPSDPGPVDDGINEQYAQSVVGPLISNVYEAFAHTDESVIYDLLERSASGDVLDSLYHEVYSAMVVSDHDQSRAIISGVTPSEITLIDSPEDGFTVSAAWEASGSIYHWGHSHQRTYAYKADLEIAPIDGAWRIVGLTITDQERLGDNAGEMPDAFLPEGFEL